MHALSVGTLALLAFAQSARAQVVSPDDAPAPQQPQQPQYPPPQQYPAPQQYPVAPQQYSPPPGYMLVPAPTVSEQELQELEAHGRKFRAIGAVLVALGALCDVLSLAFTIDHYANASPFNDPRSWEPYASLGLVLGSAGLLGAGIPILSSGIRDVRRAKRIREGRVALAPTGLSVTF